MSATVTVQIDRAEINRSNAKHSTGPRTEAGKQRSSLNALRHGLTARTAVLSSEDPAAYQHHCRQFMEEHQPATPTETQLVQQLADTSWPACLANFKKRWISFAKSNSNAVSTSAANSRTPPPSSNSISTKEFPGSLPTMASFFQKTRWNAALNA